jgi:hypothetical protein
LDAVFGAGWRFGGGGGVVAGTGDGGATPTVCATSGVQQALAIRASGGKSLARARDVILRTHQPFLYEPVVSSTLKLQLCFEHFGPVYAPNLAMEGACGQVVAPVLVKAQLTGGSSRPVSARGLSASCALRQSNIN